MNRTVSGRLDQNLDFAIDPDVVSSIAIEGRPMRGLGAAPGAGVTVSSGRLDPTTDSAFYDYLVLLLGIRIET
ncbi:hypothetical protein ACFQE5_17730 [Pseudonocardia hispaniensis]|uniref:Uncharacterized protein n=1 Tax=Pseudonocardia hispaniensis TaxID=904933 RepID=A0ABW1J5W8_9PSEU